MPFALQERKKETKKEEEEEEKGEFFPWHTHLSYKKSQTIFLDGPVFLIKAHLELLSCKITPTFLGRMSPI